MRSLRVLSMTISLGVVIAIFLALRGTEGRDLGVEMFSILIVVVWMGIFTNPILKFVEAHSK